MSKTLDTCKRIENKMDIVYDHFIGLGCVPSVCTITECAQCTIEEENMEKSTYHHERYALRNRLYAVRGEKEREIRKHYNVEVPFPETAEDIVVKIQSGKFKFADDGKHKSDPDYYCDPVREGIIFVDPDVKVDFETCHEKVREMNDDADKIQLDIDVLEPEKALKEFRKFEERTYH